MVSLAEWKKSKVNYSRLAERDSRVLSFHSCSAS